jgi:hypothetical protein
VWCIDGGVYGWTGFTNDTVIVTIDVRVDVDTISETTVVVNCCETVVVEGIVVVRIRVTVEPSPMFDTVVVTVVVRIVADPTVMVEGTVAVTVVGGGAVTIGVMVIVETDVIVAPLGPGITVDVTVVVDPVPEARITRQSSLPPFSRMVLAILLHTRRLPKANANAVAGSPLAVFAWISPESIVCRHACTRSITPCGRLSCPLTMLSITEKTDPWQNDCSTCWRRA